MGGGASKRAFGGRALSTEKRFGKIAVKKMASLDKFCRFGSRRAAERRRQVFVAVPPQLGQFSERRA